MEVLEHGAIPGIPGALLNQGMINNQNVIVILFNSIKCRIVYVNVKISSWNYLRYSYFTKRSRKSRDGNERSPI